MKQVLAVQVRADGGRGTKIISEAFVGRSKQEVESKCVYNVVIINLLLSS